MPAVYCSKKKKKTPPKPEQHETAQQFLKNQKKQVLVLSQNALALAFLQHMLLRHTAEGKSNRIKDTQVFRNDTLGFLTLLLYRVQASCSPLGFV